MSRHALRAANVVMFAGIAAALHVAKLPPALPALQAALGLDLVEAGFLLSLVQVAGMTLGLAVGLGADRLGLRRSLLLGLLMLSLASVLGGFMHGYVALLVLRGCEGLGFLLVVMPAPALIRRHVPAQQLPARMGLWAAYMPTGTALALLLGPLVLAVCDWPVWWWSLAAATALAALAVWRWVPDAAASTGAASAGEAGPAVASWSRRLGRTLRSPGPWLVSLSFAVYSGQWLAVIGFLPTVYTALGLGAVWTGVLSACVALVNVSGNVLSGRLLQRGWPARRLLHIGFACMALGALGAYGEWQGAGWPLPLRFASVLLFSALGGLVPGTLFATAVRLSPDESAVSTTIGYMQQWSAFGQFAGPPLVAWVAAQAGGWQWTWGVTWCLCLIGALLAVQIARALRVRAEGAA